MSDKIRIDFLDHLLKGVYDNINVNCIQNVIRSSKLDNPRY